MGRRIKKPWERKTELKSSKILIRCEESTWRRFYSMKSLLVGNVDNELFIQKLLDLVEICQKITNRKNLDSIIDKMREILEDVEKKRYRIEFDVVK